MWDASGSGIETVTLVLAGRLFTTDPPGKPSAILKKNIFVFIWLHCVLVAACGIFVALYAVGWAPEDVGSVAVAPELRKS